MSTRLAPGANGAKKRSKKTDAGWPDSLTLIFSSSLRFSVFSVLNKINFSRVYGLDYNARWTLMQTEVLSFFDPSDNKHLSSYFLGKSPEGYLKIVTYAPYSALLLNKSRTQNHYFHCCLSTVIFRQFWPSKSLWLWIIDICLNTSILDSKTKWSKMFL